MAKHAWKTEDYILSIRRGWLTVTDREFNNEVVYRCKEITALHKWAGTGRSPTNVVIMMAMTSGDMLDIDFGERGEEAQEFVDFIMDYIYPNKEEQ